MVIVVDDNKERLQKVMASCGVASRRKCEEIIAQGRVKVNGDVVSELGTKVSKKDVIEVDGKVLFKQEHVYYVLNKPTGYLTTVSDTLGRRTVMDLLDPETKKTRVFPVGRLDYDTSGVLLLTNDGELSYRLTRSQKEVEREYQVRVSGIIDQPAVTKLIKGVLIDGVMTKRAKVEILELNRKNDSSLLTITITEGRNRQVRKMCEAINKKVQALHRTKIGDISVKDLNIGQWRYLKEKEINQLVK